MEKINLEVMEDINTIFEDMQEEFQDKFKEMMDDIIADKNECINDIIEEAFQKISLDALIKKLSIDENKELVTNLLVSILKDRGFPVAYLESEADSSFGYYIEDENTIIPLDYAIDFQEGNPEHISQLPISILANLLDKGQYKTDKDFEFLEKEKEEALETIKEMKSMKGASDEED